MMVRVRPRPARALGDQHLPVVLAVIDANPGKGLWALAPMVGRKVGRPTLSYQALRAFLVDRGITPPQPVRKGVKKSRRTSMSHVGDVLPARPPRRSPITSGDSMPRLPPTPQLVTSEHVVAGALYSSVFALGAGGLQAAQPGRESPQLTLARRRAAELKAERLSDVQNQTSGWVSAADVGRAARAALTAALKAWKLKPDDDEFDPDRPQDWYLPEMFAEQLADLFRLAVFDLARQAGIKEAAHECNQLGQRAGAAELLQALVAKAS